MSTATAKAKRKRNGSIYDSVQELARELGISEAKAYEGLASGTIPAIRLGKRFVIPRAAIAAWLRTAAGKVA
jgi:excisionase family DNA binding protein